MQRLLRSKSQLLRAQHWYLSYIRVCRRGVDNGSPSIQQTDNNCRRGIHVQCEASIRACVRGNERVYVHQRRTSAIEDPYGSECNPPIAKPDAQVNHRKRKETNADGGVSLENEVSGRTAVESI